MPIEPSRRAANHGVRACLARASTSAALTVLLLSGCLQTDQALPFELDGDASASAAIGPQGGTLSLPSGVSLTFPPGALATSAQVTLTPSPDVAFPGDAGRVVPGTAFDVAPAGLSLRAPVQVTLRLPNRELPPADMVKLGVAQRIDGRADLLATGSYDATSRLLTGSMTTLGPVAAVIADDAIPLGSGAPPALSGGTFSTGASGSSAARAEGDGQRFASVCQPEARRCFSSGLLQVWASSELVERLGGNLVILTPRLSADLAFGGVDATGMPGDALGSLSIRGTLRVQLGRGVSSYRIDESFQTGTSATGTPSTTTVRAVGNRLILSRTSDGDDRTLQYDLRRVGTGRVLTLRLEEEVALENDDGSTTTGTVILHVRLRG